LSTVGGQGGRLTDEIRISDFGAASRRQTTQVETYLWQRLAAEGVPKDRLARAVSEMPGALFDDAPARTNEQDALEHLARFTFGPGPGSAEERDKTLEEGISAAVARHKGEPRTPPRHEKKEDEGERLAAIVAGAVAAALAGKNGQAVTQERGRPTAQEIEQGLAHDAVLFDPSLWARAAASPLELRTALVQRFPAVFAAAGFERSLAEDMLRLLLAWFAAVLAERAREDDDDETESLGDPVFPRVALDWLVRCGSLAAGVPAQRVNDEAGRWPQFGWPRLSRYASLLGPAGANAKQTTTTKATPPPKEDPWHFGAAAFAALPPEARAALKKAKADRPKKTT
jgi:hypothetical protein